MLFDSYECFLCALRNNDQRALLEQLQPADAERDSLFQELRDAGHRFQSALNELFQPENDPNWIAHVIF